MQQISWEVMKIYPLKIYGIRYWSFFLSGMSHVSYVCFLKHSPEHQFTSLKDVNLNLEQQSVFMYLDSETQHDWWAVYELITNFCHLGMLILTLT